jgi:pimeloyl-ACP methyl ester carboxylesterase
MAAILRAVDFGTERCIEAGGARLSVHVLGEPTGRDALYWHGVGLSSRGGASLDAAGPALARDHDVRVLALDAPGFGGSPALGASRYHPHALADLVPPFLDELGVERAAFIGFSWGGDVGLHALARHPDRLTALVLLDAGYSDPPFEPSVPLESRVEHYRSLARTTPGTTVPPAVVAAVEHGIAQSLPSTTRASLAASGLPVLLVASAGAAEEDLVTFAADVPQTEVLRPAGVGHDVLRDGGAEVVRAVGEWLSARG